MSDPTPVILVVGDTFTLTDYTRYTDYKQHQGEAGTVEDVMDIGYPFHWPDGTKSILHRNECLSDWVIKQ